MTAAPHSNNSSELLAKLQQAAATVIDPELRRPLTELGMLPVLEVSETGKVRAVLELTIAGCPAAQQIETELRRTLLSVSGVTVIDLTVQVMSAARRSEFIKQLRGNKKRQFSAPSLTRVIAVTSGKGGVGKSTLTANLAVCLAQQGFAVGLIDADVFGFSIPAMLGLVAEGKTVQPTQLEQMILPPVAHGVKTISIGMFLGDKDARTTAVSWRGPMLHRTIEQFLTDVYFGDLDFLLLDLPPGTGDVAISIGQLLPQAEVLVVTTPQAQAADVATRSGILAQQCGQRVIGVVENLSGFMLPDGTLTQLFGAGGGAAVAQRLSTQTGYAVPLLAQLPVSAAFNEAADQAQPLVIFAPQDPAASALHKLAAKLAQRPDSLNGKTLPLNIKS